MKTLKNIAITTIIGGAIAFGTVSASPKKKANEPSIQTPSAELVIQNDYEWGELKEAVVGRWEINTFITPKIDSSVREFYPYISDEAFEYMIKAQDKPLSEAYPEDDQQYHNETEALVHKLEELGVKVRRPDEMEFPVVATSQVYSRDPIITIGNKVILTNMYGTPRRQESANYRRIALDIAKKYEGEVISMPANKPGYHKDNLYLEGGDVFVAGNEVYVGLSGNATNKKGIEWLQNTLGDSYTVHTIPLHKNVLHLDCAMMLINQKQGVICKEDFVDFEAAPKSLKERQWVNAKPKEAQVMATNGIVVNAKTIIMSDAFPHIANQIREMGVEVHEIKYKKANYFGGGLRCSYQPIVRK